MKFQKELAALREVHPHGSFIRKTLVFYINDDKRFEIGLGWDGLPTYGKHVRKSTINGRATVTTTTLLPIEVKILMDMKGE
jgi:hypothetical protein